MGEHFKETILHGHHLDLLSIALSREFDIEEKDHEELDYLNRSERMMKDNYPQIRNSLKKQGIEKEPLKEIEQKIHRSVSYLQKLKQTSKTPAEKANIQTSISLIKALVKIEAKNTLYKGYKKAWEKEKIQAYKNIVNTLEKREHQGYKQTLIHAQKKDVEEHLHSLVNKKQVIQELTDTKEKMRPTQRKLIRKFMETNALNKELIE